MSHDASYCNDTWDAGNSPDCHLIGDTGADLYNAFRGNLTW